MNQSPIQKVTKFASSDTYNTNIQAQYQQYQNDTPDTEEISFEEFLEQDLESRLKNQSFEQGEWDLTAALKDGTIKIAKSAQDAKDGNWTTVNPEYWGDKEGLRYETKEDGTILIYEGDTPLGWTYQSNSNNVLGITTNLGVKQEKGIIYFKQEDGSYVSIRGDYLGIENISQNEPIAAFENEEQSPIENSEQDNTNDTIDSDVLKSMIVNKASNGSSLPGSSYAQNISINDLINSQQAHSNNDNNSRTNYSDFKVITNSNGEIEIECISTEYNQETGYGEPTTATISKESLIEVYGEEAYKSFAEKYNNIVKSDIINKIKIPVAHNSKMLATKMSINDLIKANSVSVQLEDGFFNPVTKYSDFKIVTNESGGIELEATSQEFSLWIGGEQKIVKFTEENLREAYGDEAYESFAKQYK